MAIRVILKITINFLVSQINNPPSLMGNGHLLKGMSKRFKKNCHKLGRAKANTINLAQLEIKHRQMLPILPSLIERIATLLGIKNECLIAKLNLVLKV